MKINILELGKNNYTNQNSGKKFLRDVFNDLQIPQQLEYFRGDTPFCPYTHTIGGIISHKGCLSSGCRNGSEIQGWPLWHTNHFITITDSLTL